MQSLVIANARIHGVGPTDLVVEGGRITAVDLDRTARPVGSEVVDAQGALLLPTLVDGHAHPDKTTFGEAWLSRPPAQSLVDLIEHDVQVQKQQTRSVAVRAGRLLEQYVVSGARAVRAHVDVAPPYGLDNLRGVREAALGLAHALDVQIVAFPQLGILRAPGTAELLRDAVAAGADLIGGIDPVGLEGDLDGHLDLVFGLGADLGVGLDIHLHDRGEVGLQQVEAILRRTVDGGLQGRVAIGHAFCYADCPPDRLPDLAAATAEAGVALATCALGTDPVLPLAALRGAGVTVALGSDGVRDAWTPFGNGNLLDRTHLLAYLTGAATDEELELCLDVAAHAGAELLGLPRSGLAVGDPADLMVVDAECPAQAVVDRPTPRWVIRAGRVVAADGRLTAPPQT